MSEDVSLRDATLDDIAAVAALEAVAFPSPWRAEFFVSEIGALHRFSRVAMLQGGLVGYVFAMYYLDEMHINKIAVAEAARRHGIATRLMSDCLTFARANDVRTLSLEVRASNEPAQAFYRKLNFASVYKRPGYYPDGEDAVVMMAGVTDPA